MTDPTAATAVPQCANCGAQEGGDVHLLRCQACLRVAYCSRECQKMDWKFEHKGFCQQPAEVYDMYHRTVPHPMSIRQAEAFYRNAQGTEWFMGIVTNPDMDMVKLNDPSGELDGPGHFMTDNEFFTECFHYDDYSQHKGIPKIQTEGFELMDFRHKPQEFPVNVHDNNQEVFDVRYPHGVPPASNRAFIGRTPEIRCGDRVCVVLVTTAATEEESKQQQRQLWVKVWSITAFDMVTGHIITPLLSDYETTELRLGRLIAFHATKVLGVVHGTNWP